MQRGVAWRRRLRSAHLVLALSTSALGASAQTPPGQPSKPVDGEFSVQRFDPAPGPRNFFTTRGARISGKMAYSAGLFVNYAKKPFVLVSCASLTKCDQANAVNPYTVNIVENLVQGDLMGSLTPIERLQVGLKVPVAWREGDDWDPSTGTATGKSKTAVGMGDMLLEGKYRAHGEVDDPVVIGAAGFVSAPLGKLTAGESYIGDSTPTLGLRGIFDGRQDKLSIGGNLVAMYRGKGRVGSTPVGSEFRYGIAAGYEVSELLRVVVDSIGSTRFSGKNGTNALEVDGGVQLTPQASPFTFSVGAGTGVIEGVGVPSFRAFVGALYVHESADRDQDGIQDLDDQCPTEAEDKDGHDDSDGCPDLDDDGDQVPDAKDKCPDKGEDPDNYQDDDGCPDLDDDKDGIPDLQDQCRLQPETKNGFKDDDGCPDAKDTDGDGVADEQDKCPNEAEDTDGFEDTDGCPDPDNDKDGVPDAKDECADEPETANGKTDEDGCPD